VLGCALTIAFILNLRIDKRISRLEALISLIGFFRTQIDCFCTPVGEIFRRADKSLLGKCGFSYIPQSADDFSALRAFISDEAYAELYSFASELGTLYREEQLKRCDYYLTRLREILTREKADGTNQKKLNTVLCVFASLCIIILFI